MGEPLSRTWVHTTQLPQPAANFQANVNTATGWDLYKTVPIFSMRNGRAEDVRSILVRATLPPAWHWIPVVGLPPTMAVTNLDIFIKSHMFHLTKNTPPNYSSALIRKAAICLGTLRAACTTYYELTPADFITGELGQAYIHATAGAGGAANFGLIQEIPPIPGVEGAAPTPDPHRAILTDPLVLTEQEQSVVGELIKCGIGLIPMQGYALIMSNHHYLPDPANQARKVYEAVEKAYWIGPGISDFFTTDLLSLQDVCWHKAGHPVSMDFKIQRSISTRTKEMLVDANAGACASRLPAVESELRAAGSYLQLLTTVEPMFRLYGGSIDTYALTEMIRIVKSFDDSWTPGTPNLEVPEEWRTTVTTRKTALKRLQALLEMNQNNVALCYGFYCAHSNRGAMTGGASGRDTLKMSASLSKLKDNNRASYTTGELLYADYAGARAKTRERGEFEAPKLSMG